MGIHGVRMINELKGIRQLELDAPSPKNQLQLPEVLWKCLR
jgi:DNA polymerase V